MEDVTYLNDELATVQSRNNLFDISLFKSTEYFASIETFVGFVKACEKMIRGSSEYKVYKAQLMEQGLTRCQFLGAIEADEDDAAVLSGRDPDGVCIHAAGGRQRGKRTDADAADAGDNGSVG